MAASNSKSGLKFLDYPVPPHANSILYMFGGIALAAFAILVGTGLFLSQVYIPTPEKAHESIVNAITTVPLADFARSLHFWVANLVVALLLLHIIRVFITGAYKKPRRLTWLTGVGLLAVTIGYIFVGTVLKWDQEGVEAFGHMKESFALFGVQIGLTNSGVPVITQLYTWHILILGMALLGLLVIHMVLIKLRGISAKPARGAVSSVTAHTGTSSFLVHLQRLAGFGLVFLALAGLLSVIFPAPLGYPGLPEQEVTKPLWMFWPFFGLEDIFGLKGLVAGMIAFFAFLVAVPFIDRSPYLHYAKRKLILSLGVLVVVLLVAAGAYSRLAPPKAHLDEMPGEDAKAEVASAENLNISHQLLADEAVYLIPILGVVGLTGVWLSYKRRS